MPTCAENSVKRCQHVCETIYQLNSILQQMSYTNLEECCGQDPYDTDGWGEYGADWQHYFDCMLSPTATQIEKALKALNLKVASDAGGNNRIKRQATPVGPHALNKTLN